MLKRSFDNWFIYLFITFSIFTSILLSFIFLLNSDINPAVLTYGESISGLTQNENGISGNFIAKENFLGIITLHFQKIRPEMGDALFRIREKSSNKWLHTASISTVQFFYRPDYPFGFPIVEKSRGKEYYFELITSSKTDKIYLDKDQKNYYLSYSFPKKILLSDPKIFKDFLIKKVIYYLARSEFLTVFAIYFLPFLSLIIYLIIHKKFFYLYKGRSIEDFLSNTLRPLIIAPSFIMIFDVFVLRTYSEKLILFALTLFLISTYTFNIRYEIFFGAAMLLLAYCPFLFLLPMSWVGEKASIWAYLILIIGTLLAIISETKLTSLYKYKPMRLLRFIFLKIDSIFNKLFLSPFKKIFNWIANCIERRPTTSAGWMKLFIFVFIGMIGFYVFYIVSINIFRYVNSSYIAYSHSKTRLSLDPFIETIEPFLVYKGTKVIIYGRGFSWNKKEIRLLVDGKEINPEILTDTEIIFTVPLDWKMGDHTVWIEKKLNWDGKNIIAKSKKAKIRMSTIGMNNGKDDELFFEQLKNMHKKTLIINGYE